MSKVALTIYRRSADCFIERPSSYRAVNTFHLGYKNKSVILYEAEVAVYSQKNTKRVTTVWTESTVTEC
jgi:hypothetical protein